MQQATSPHLATVATHSQTVPAGLHIHAQYSDSSIQDVTPISEEEIERIQEIFRPFDDTGKGKAPIDDLPTILRLLGYNLSETEFEEIKIAISEKRGGKMPVFNFEDLLELL